MKRAARHAVVAGAAIVAIAGGCGPQTAARRAERGERERDERDPPCLPFADKKPAPSRGEACGDGIAGERCVEVTTHSCHESERGTSVQCEPSEICDGQDLRGQTCDSLGLAGKGLRCRADCNDFDSSACDACPKRSGVTCTDLPLPKGRIAQVIARAPSGAFAVLVVDDDGNTSAFVRATTGMRRASQAGKQFQPRHLAVAGKDEFLAGGDRRDDAFVVAPLSYRGGLAPTVRVPMPESLRSAPVRSQLETTTADSAVIVVRDGPSGRVVAMIPLDAQGKRTAMPGDVPLVVNGAAALAGCLVELTSVGGSCDIAATLEDGKAARGSGTLDAGSCGRITASMRGSEGVCEASWTKDGKTHAFTRDGVTPPAIHGATGWSRTSKRWVGHRMGIAIELNP